MEFRTYSSPHLSGPAHVGRLMRGVMLAAVPGLLMAWWFFGWGVLINLVLALATCIGAEAAVLRLRRRPVRATLADGSAALTALLLALTLPPFAPWWIPVIGGLFAIVIAKQLYGGLGYNPFNPAMVGYVVLLISFPREMTLWAPPQALAEVQLSLVDTLAWSLLGSLPANVSVDAISMATPLDTIKTQLGLGLTLTEIQAGPRFGDIGGYGWEWVNLGFLLGGGWLLYRGTIQWQIPAGVLGGLFVMALLFYAVDSDTYASPLFHLFSGAAMLGAFFIATDPVSASTTPRGRLLYGAGIGILIYIIRAWGGYPDGVAFAVLLMNMAVPTIDYYTQPRVYGQERK
ncbi:electron transport complex subunit D [Thiohalobacter sp. COW1]|uniref:Ion-translocating oxidoreductase complex subunit D n=1 Tax=Thiohalobacter thiocyanaticus TaxID=585455 RepID=A0A1Z4VPV2_9GAMM|nr:MULTISPECIES: electron transport complex subunit RsxD [Thiohalobacter]BAZ93368.1 NADH:ubiquinone oxidoreductase, subunit RnfD [Thiohalobacter thiocyanaticus]BCO31589.1 electron transport complex subunit D [Thiohalobacter sp. COW1]